MNSCDPQTGSRGHRWHSCLRLLWAAVPPPSPPNVSEHSEMGSARGQPVPLGSRHLILSPRFLEPWVFSSSDPPAPTQSPPFLAEGMHQVTGVIFKMFSHTRGFKKCSLQNILTFQCCFPYAFWNPIYGSKMRFRDIPSAMRQM